MIILTIRRALFLSPSNNNYPLCTFKHLSLWIRKDARATINTDDWTTKNRRTRSKVVFTLPVPLRLMVFTFLATRTTNQQQLWAEHSKAGIEYGASVAGDCGSSGRFSFVCWFGRCVYIKNVVVCLRVILSRRMRWIPNQACLFPTSPTHPRQTHFT